MFIFVSKHFSNPYTEEIFKRFLGKCILGMRVPKCFETNLSLSLNSVLHELLAAPSFSHDVKACSICCCLQKCVNRLPGR